MIGIKGVIKNDNAKDHYFKGNFQVNVHSKFSTQATWNLQTVENCSPVMTIANRK